MRSATSQRTATPNADLFDSRVEPDHLAANAPGHGRIALFIGKGEPKHHINVPKAVLAEKSPYMKKIIDSAHGGDVPYDKTTFEDFDEFGAGLV